MKRGNAGSDRTGLARLAETLAPVHGYNPTRIPSVRILRSEAALHDVPVLYRPGAVFVLQGRKQGVLDGTVYRYDEEHYLAVSVPVPFRMESAGSPKRPLLAVYVEFDMALAAEIASAVADQQPDGQRVKARSLVSSRMTSEIADVVRRLLGILQEPLDTAVLGDAILRELHYRVFIGPQGGAMVAALRRQGIAGRIIQSLVRLRESYNSSFSVAALARDAGMSVPSYHAHFKALTGSSPIQYVKAMRLHEARLMIARQYKSIAEVAASVGYVSQAQFSRDFKRHFHRTASEEARWVREHLGEVG
ncbi:AraC family transcriptional regulator [Xanthobacter sp. KR7-65]|uniref:AraC family transcriptional regulator n=1 Tax=Xanthobacter sp. KR7-65 TaxID=3156612 RepID=UPI0032B556BF